MSEEEYTCDACGQKVDGIVPKLWSEKINEENKFKTGMALGQLLTASPWVRVSDRLPEEGAWVKLGMKSKASPTGWWENTAIYYVDEEGDDYWAVVNYNGGKRLFHPSPDAMWKPLPPPPEEE